jgi:hypothetical protein
MTEEEWLSGRSLESMMRLVHPQSSERKWALLAVAWYRTLALVIEEDVRDSFEKLEQWADSGRKIDRERWDRPCQYLEDDMRLATEDQVTSLSWLVGLLNRAIIQFDGPLEPVPSPLVQQAWACWVRDLYGNPFRPVTIEPRWLTSNVVDLSRTIYDERDFDRLPILADALMDAGCADESILSHCRSEGPHVRGCWVVDLVLGKT